MDHVILNTYYEDAAQAKTDRATAHELLDSAEKSRIQHLADRCGRTFSAMHKHLRSECHGGGARRLCAGASRAD